MRLFLAAFLSALLLRISVLLATPGLPFWFDEAWTAQFATFPSSPAVVVARVAAEDLHPPLGYLAFKAWALLVGVRDPVTAPPPPGHEDRLRFLPLLTGALGAGFLALALRALGALPTAALAGTLLAWTSPVTFSVGLEVRQYGLLLLLLPLLIWAWATRKKALFALTGAAALYTQYFSLFYLLPLALAGRLSRSALVAFALFLPWAPTLLKQAKSPLAQEARNYVLPPAAFFSSLLEGLGGGALGALLVLLAALGLARSRPALLSAVGFALSLVAFGFLFGGTSRYSVLLVPFLGLGLGLLLDRVGRWLEEKSGASLALFLPLPLLMAAALPAALQSRLEAASIGAAILCASAAPVPTVHVFNRPAAFTFRYYDRRKGLEPVGEVPPDPPAVVIAPNPASLPRQEGLWPSWLWETELLCAPGPWTARLWRGSQERGR